MKGKLKKDATIYSNDPEKPKTKISVSALIRQYVNIEPSARVILQGYQGEKIKKQVIVTAIEEKNIKITDITTDIKDKIKYKLKTVKKGEKYSLDIRTRSGIKESFQGEVVLKTDSQKKSEINLFVFGKLLSNIKVSPQYLYYGIIDNSKEVIDPKSLKRTVWVNAIRGDCLTVEKIESSKDWINTETEVNQKGKYTIFISLNEEKLPKGKFREKINIHTKCKKESEVVSVIIEGKVI